MKKLLIILLLCGCNAFAQDSIIWLKPPQKTKVKTETVKTKGEELASHGFSAIAEHVTLVEGIPAGQLHTLTFYFNSGLINLNKGEFNVEYADTNLRLMVYTVGADGKPGALLTPTPLYFTVKASHRGALDLDLSFLNLATQPQLYIGMAATESHDKETVMLKVRENKDAVSYTKAKGSNNWVEYDDGSGFKFDIKMKVGVKG
ncbi:hypothetical protein AM493_07435 [Flavobacterium akiainvivens]|uniref:Uncharacterized protein n=1 Tax=Flavobacterium akiainvivens TaxID=1202724 RepID=A0A0M9VHS0_9FLAO|nr:hypothetical protein [Flavobacterium akiainvivens]KOS05886.1 hypothetical protein AM493_07435 [Flavobacterium akiainvivens]SFQ56252.1 hypothetical protein SAMN05444144_10830 [Flavobacterium akiainvivens]